MTKWSIPFRRLCSENLSSVRFLLTGSTWKQDSAKVTFVVELPRRPSSIEDVDTEFTDSTASVSLKGESLTAW